MLFKLLSFIPRYMIVQFLFYSFLNALFALLLAITVGDYLASIFNDQPKEPNFKLLALLYSTTDLKIVIPLSVILIGTIVGVAKINSSNRLIHKLWLNLSNNIYINALNEEFQRRISRHASQDEIRIISELQIIVNQYARPICEIFSSAISISFLIAGFMLIGGIYSLIGLLCIGALYILVYKLNSKKVEKLSANRIDLNKRRYDLVKLLTNEIRQIKVYNSRAKVAHYFDATCQRLFDTLCKIGNRTEIPPVIIYGGIYLLIIIGSYVLTFNTAEDGLALLLPALVIFQRLLPELGRFINSFTTLIVGATAARKILDELSVTYTTDQSISDAVVTTPQSVPNTINKSISYTRHNNEIFKDLEVSIKKGDFICIVGPSGSGKSTLLDILLGLQGTQGNFLADFRVGLVPQTCHIIEGSLEDNLRLYSNRDVSTQSMESILKDVSLYCSIPGENINDKLATLLGENNFSLSGGQLKRLALARALITEPDILVLDEVTSGLDDDMATQIVDRLNSMDFWAIIMVTHNMNLLNFATKTLHIPMEPSDEDL